MPILIPEETFTKKELAPDFLPGGKFTKGKMERSFCGHLNLVPWATTECICSSSFPSFLMHISYLQTTYRVIVL
jgi:hypothetical protein